MAIHIAPTYDAKWVIVNESNRINEVISDFSKSVNMAKIAVRRSKPNTARIKLIGR